MVTLTLFPPSLPLSLPPYSLDHLLFPLFSGCSKCLETAVRTGTGPGGWPHQGTVRRGFHQTQVHTTMSPVRVCVCVCLKLIAKPHPCRLPPSSAPSPHTHTQQFRSTFFFHRKAVVGVYIYMHYAPVSAWYFAWWLSPPKLSHDRHEGFLHVPSLPFPSLPISSTTRKGGKEGPERRIQ